jgi:1-deoxy-D-xylulose-5-phosphate reductoisomerase
VEDISVREIVILGSTGSIGVQALEVIEANPHLFKVVALAAGGGNLSLIAEQAAKFGVSTVGVSRGGAELRSLAPQLTVIDGPPAASEIAAITCDVVLNGITGSIGLAPTLAALSAGNKVALANKESLVAGGDLVTAFGLDRIIPVDSEHSALYQCFLSGSRSEVKRAILTASGGAFRDRTNLDGVTLAEALAHPTWSMGPVVTINSATLVNKGLEIIEAHYLFDLPYSQIEAVIHPQSVIHSMVEFIDGATIAQLSPPNMKGPIAYALGAPNRTADATAPVDWSSSHSWSFSPIEENRYPSINLARHCGSLGGGLPAVFNAANEVAVDAFMNGEISFTSIVEVVAQSAHKLETLSSSAPRDLADVSAIEKDARMVARTFVEEKR